MVIWLWLLVYNRGSFCYLFYGKMMKFILISGVLDDSWVNVVFGGAGPQFWRVIDNIHERIEDIFVWHDRRMEVIWMEVGRVGVDCVAFWACHFCSVVVGPANKYGYWKGGEWLCGVLGLPLLFCGGRSICIGAGIFHCGDLSGGFWSGSGEMRLTGGFWDIVGCLWLLVPWCWYPLVMGNYWLLLLPHLYNLYLSSFWIALFYAMMILNLSMHTTATPGEGEGESM